MIIVAVTFIAGFLASELWQSIGSRSARNRGETGHDYVGLVGDHKITFDEYRNAAAYVTDKYKQDNRLRDLSTEDYAAIEQQTWRYLVNELSWARLYRNAKIGVTREEVVEIMKANPPAELAQNPELYTDGKFDYQKYEQVMQNPQNEQFFAKYFRELVEMLPKEKFRIDVASAWRITEGEATDAIALANTRWKVTSLTFGPQVAAGITEPTEAELKAFYDQHREEFRRKESRQLTHVIFPVRITAQDSQAVAEAIERAHAQLVAGENFNLTMLDFSDLQPETLSTSYLRSRIDPATDTVLRSLKPGGYSKPFLTSYGWQIVMLDSARGDSVSMRRIVIRMKSSGENVAAMRDSAAAFIDQAEKDNFDSVAARFHLRPMPYRAMVDGELSLGAIQLDGADQLIDWARVAKKGVTFGKPLRSAQGFYVFHLAEIQPNAIPDFETAKPGVAWKLRQEREKAAWTARAEEALAQIRAGKSFEQYAAENPTVQLLTEEFDGIIGAMRRKGPEFGGAMAALATGDKYGVLDLPWGASILRCDERTEIQPPPLDPQTWVQQRREKVGQDLLQALLGEAKVKDYREGSY